MMELQADNKVIFVMGVSGSGKSYIGRLLAIEMSLPFIDADDYHSTQNIHKMSSGVALDDQDREPWLYKVNKIARENKNSGCVIACSALKEKYRSLLSNSIEQYVKWIYLRGTYERVLALMEKRVDHFMQANMLKSQFEALEEPMYGATIDIDNSPGRIIQKIKSHVM
ncbi:MAG: gluconokinase, GntK/IdnK-type [bacterium]|nr:gluconokinase, GntK/IdnK-type [bacterium]